MNKILDKANIKYYYGLSAVPSLIVDNITVGLYMLGKGYYIWFCRF